MRFLNCPKNFIINSYHKAFTLIELMIVVSIIAVITGAIVPSFNTFINNQSVKQASEKIKSDLRSMQSNAIANSVLPGMTVSDRVFWGMYFEEGSSDYYYFASTTDPDTSSCVNEIKDSQKYTMPANTYSINNYCVVFDSREGSAKGSSFVVVKSTSSDNYECIKINTSGLIVNGVYENGECV